MRGVSYKDLLKDKLDPAILSRIPRSFDIVGDIALIKLDPELVRYGPSIAEAIMSVHRNVKSVYARFRTVGVERINELTHIGGEDRSETIYVENGVRFRVDLRYMYVNTRLSTERLMIANMIGDHERVLDMFSSYGPFSLNIAKIREAEVVATDINCRAIEFLGLSLKLNRLRGVVYPVCSDSYYLDRVFGERLRFTTIIMDNPTNIAGFIPIARSLLERGGRIIIYVLADSLDEALKKVLPYAGEGLRFEGYRVVKEYSARSSIYRLVFKDNQ